MKVTEA
jgi:hypothetical protein